MENKILNNNEKTVEDYLKQVLNKLNSPNRRGTKVGAWIFNSIYGSHSFGYNKQVLKTDEMTKEKISEYHAERQCIKSMPKKFKTNGKNTMYVTLIPCNFCVQHLIDQTFDIDIIYFVDKYQKIKSFKYKKLLKKIKMIQYINKGNSTKSKEINTLIKDIETFTN